MTPRVASHPLPCRQAAQRMTICMLVICLGEPIPALSQSTPSLPAGTMVWARLDRRVSSKTAHVGDKVEAVTVKPVKRHGQVVLPADTHLRGTVQEVHAADRPHKTPARLNLVFTEMILPDGRTVPTKASLQHWELDGGTLRASAFGLAGGAALGAIVGAFWGAKGAGIGAAVGAGFSSLGLLPLARTRWRDIELCDCWRVPVRLDNDLVLPPTPAAKP